MISSRNLDASPSTSQFEKKKKTNKHPGKDGSQLVSENIPNIIINQTMSDEEVGVIQLDN